MRAAVVLGVAGSVLLADVASANIVIFFSDPSGLAAEAEFDLLNPTTLQIRLRNTSTGVPLGFDSSDQLLTGLSWDFGAPGFNGDVMITGGTVVTGPTSYSLNFDITNVGSNEDVSGEWGYGNMDGTGALTNFISGNAAQATPFGGPNRDGSENIDGPQAGLVANPEPVDLGGLGAIQDEIIATLSLSGELTKAALLKDLVNNHVRVEFGSDAAYIEVPAPGAAAVLGLAGLLGAQRRRRR